MKKKIAIISGVVIAVALIGVAIWYFVGRGNDQSDTKDVVYVTKISTIQELGTLGFPNRFAGVVEPQQTFEVELQSDKILGKVLVEEGQEVKAGTPLFTYDTEQTEAELNQAQLDLDRLNNETGNLNTQIATLQKEKKTASADEQLNYTTQIQMAQNDLKKNEYDIKSKNIEIEKLKDSIQNSTVTSEIDGVVKSINQDGSGSEYGSSTSNAFITILQTGQYRIKGTVNEQNMSLIQEGSPVIIRSRVDDTTWRGTMGNVDTENAQANSNGSMMYYGGSSSNTENQSSSYPFYVNLDSAEGLMLGQHVYIEMDEGQDVEKIGVWLAEYMIADIDTDPYVWADDGHGKLVKKPVILGQYDEDLIEYEIADGLEEDDAITFPEDSLKEGMATEITSDGIMGNQNPPEEEMNGGEELEGDIEIDPDLEGEEEFQGDGKVIEGDELQKDGIIMDGEGQIQGGSLMIPDGAKIQMEGAG